MMIRGIGKTAALMFFAITACQKNEAGETPAGAAQSVTAQATDSASMDSIKTLEQDWADAVRTRDSATLESLVAANFSLSDEASANPPVPRSTWMDNTLHNLKVDSIRLSNQKVVVKGDTATATLDFFWAGQFKTLPPFRDSTTLTDTWVRSGNAWQVHRRVLVK